MTENNAMATTHCSHVAIASTLPAYDRTEPLEGMRSRFQPRRLPVVSDHGVPPEPTAPAPGPAPSGAAEYVPPRPMAPGGYPTVIYVQPRTNGYAVAALVLGIVWVYGITSILALVFGYRAKREIDESRGEQTGRGMAIAGIVLGWVGIGLMILVIVAFVALFAFLRDVSPAPSPSPTLL
jgi:uncharacterized protein DUF4190